MSKHPTIDVIRRAYELAETGMTQREISGIVGFNIKAVNNWLVHPETYSPYLDEVALSRAWEERAVYDNLSKYEYQTFWSRVGQASLASGPAGSDPDTLSGRLAGRLGMSIVSVLDRIESQKRRERAFA